MRNQSADDDVRELTDRDFARAIPRKQRPALALLRVVARHPRILRENLAVPA